MLPRFAGSALALLLFSISHATPRVAWTHSARQSGFDTAMSMATDGAGNVTLLVGYGPSWENGDLMVRRLNSAGRVLWTRTLVSPGQKRDAGVLALDRQGNVYVAATASGTTANGDEAVLTKLDTAGRPVWRTALNGVPGQPDGFRTVAVDGLGNVFVAGTTSRSTTQEDVVVRRVNPANGAAIWTATFGSAGTDACDRMLLDRQGNVIVSGTWSENTYAAKFDAATGRRIWLRGLLSGTGNDAREGAIVGLDPAMNVIHASNLTSGLTSTLVSVRKIQGSNGAVLWGPKDFDNSDEPMTSYEGGSVDSAGNSTLVLTYDNSVANVQFITLQRLNSAGGEVWARTHTEARDVRMLGDGRGNVWAAFTQGESVRLVRYAANGDLVYSIRLPLTAARSITRDATGAMLILGDRATAYGVVRVIGG